MGFRALVERDRTDFLANFGGDFWYFSRPFFPWRKDNKEQAKHPPQKSTANFQSVLGSFMARKSTLQASVIDYFLCAFLRKSRFTEFEGLGGAIL